MLPHVSYPHPHGRLYDCPGCAKGRCICDESRTGCASEICVKYPWPNLTDAKNILLIGLWHCRAESTGPAPFLSDIRDIGVDRRQPLITFTLTDRGWPPRAARTFIATIEEVRD